MEGGRPLGVCYLLEVVLLCVCDLLVAFHGDGIGIEGLGDLEWVGGLLRFLKCFFVFRKSYILSVF